MDRIELAASLSIAAMIVFFGWGVFLLYLRIGRRAEIPLAIEVATLAALLVFLSFEYSLARITFPDDLLSLVFTMLGLAAATAALYGPMLASMAARIVVHVMAPGGGPAEATPHFGSAEQREEGGDLEGALAEYLIIARAFPEDPSVAVRVGDVYAKLEHFKKAAPWLERAFAAETSPEAALLLANRLAELYERKLGDRPAARDTLETYLKRFPAGEHRDRAARRLARLDETEAGC